jgi:KipI family sensor histidine kinase inhibitor
MPAYKLLPAGDTALVVEFGDRIERPLNNLVLALAKRLRDARIDGVTDILPTFRSLMVQYDPLLISSKRLIELIGRATQGLRPTEVSGRRWHLPVCYDPQVAPDIAEVAAQTNFSAAQLIERHSAVTYHVYMLGFLPGQAYMGDVPAELVLPRRQTPRMKIPAGSLAMATTMTCIFPLETPCGWHLIGRSPVRLWDMASGLTPLLAPGDVVTFAPISLGEYENLLAKVADGQFQVAPIDVMEAAA